MLSELAQKRYFHVYGRAMDAAIRQKTGDIFPWVKPGVICDAGFGTGLFLNNLARQFTDSEIYGIDASRHFFIQAKKRFGKISRVHLLRTNLLKRAFSGGFLDTKIFSSVLHEVYSYNGYRKQAVERALRTSFRELKQGGRLIIRDGIKPERAKIFLRFLPEKHKRFSGNPMVADTETMFLRFAREFKGDAVAYVVTHIRGGQRLYKTDSSSAYEFLSKKDFRRNWHIEVSEQFGYFTRAEYIALLRRIGFQIVHIRAYQNPWIIKNRWQGKIALYKKDARGVLRPQAFPATNIVIIAEK